MQYAISLLPVIPLRSEPSDKSEMVSQVLFGELLTILNKQPKWSFVENSQDSYTGWLYNPMIHQISKESFQIIKNKPLKISGNLFLPVFNETNKITFHIPAGSSLYDYKPASNSFIIDDISFTCKNEPVFYDYADIRKTISRTAMGYLNVPYLWGGRNTFGMDCSGFTQTLMKIYGRYIPRDAHQQVKTGKTVNFISEALPGDMAFFDNEEGEISHTGIITEHQHIVHASGKVRCDRIDHQGIYDSKLKQYIYKLRIIKNIID